MGSRPPTINKRPLDPEKVKIRRGRTGQGFTLASQAAALIAPHRRRDWLSDRDVAATWNRRHQVGGWLRGPGRPGWLPTPAPLRSGLAHHAHPVPHLMNSRPARSVVVTWTWFRSRCTCQVSLQRLMRRHPLPSTGFLGLVPPLQRYYEVLRLPAAHFAALRFLRLAIPSLRPLFVPPGPGRGAGDHSGVGRRYLQPPCSMETAGSPKFPGDPS